MTPPPPSFLSLISDIELTYSAQIWIGLPVTGTSRGRWGVEAIDCRYKVTLHTLNIIGVLEFQVEVEVYARVGFLLFEERK